MEQVFEQLSEDSKDFWTPRSIARIPQPTPLEFYRNYVSKNIPVIITNAMDSWPAMAKWTNEYLVDTLGETQVTVDVTPFGYGDAVVRHSIVHTWHPLTHPFQTTVGTENVFVMPEERSMSFRDFLAILHDPCFDGVPSIAMQDNNDLTPWIPVNPLHPQVEKYPLTKHLQPLVVTLEAGETLYLPSLWYHRATQLTETVAVNYW
ncbi:hypothetical protein DYB25_000307 [Aphanomyces astaci]|uniref:JmjC domain-containing protein n=2 Tax=Aphanomyces astaci TaxID=112090 RepID=A0A397BI59_APHAT|nr:hypothetical protein DYB25_000307 [Aphanomyces astaci]RHY56390.1 hypothetical protein DYB34_000581 [Aphanomyces astaci]